MVSRQFAINITAMGIHKYLYFLQEALTKSRIINIVCFSYCILGGLS